MHKEKLKNMTNARFLFSLNKSLTKNKTDCISRVILHTKKYNPHLFFTETSILIECLFRAT